VAGETVTPRTLVSAAVIVAAVALIIRHGAARPAAVEPEEDAPVDEYVAPLTARSEGGRR
jgi:hypothetical protein